jgi:hypothetical protein
MSGIFFSGERLKASQRTTKITAAIGSIGSMMTGIRLTNGTYATLLRPSN